MAELQGSEKLLLLMQAVSTWFMTGLIWFVQVVHYPLYARVGAANFETYERAHCALTTGVVAPVMVIELLTAVLLVLYHTRLLGVFEPLAALAMLLVIWAATLFIADALHGSLAAGFTRDAYQALLGWNWLRTVLWSLRAVLVAHFCWRCMV